MARTLIPTQSIGANGAGIDGLTWTAWDGSNTMYFNNDGRSVLLARNKNASSRTLTIVSVADPYGRTGDKTVTCAGATGSPLANVLSAYGPFPPALFNQVGTSQVYVNGASQTDFDVAVVSLPL
jgi:hypothetical protein